MNSCGPPFFVIFLPIFCPILSQREMGMNNSNTHVLRAIKRLRFVVARSMPHIPHEYTLREWADEDDDYVALFNSIMEQGKILYYVPHRRPGRYLYPGDGYAYWSMGARRSINIHAFHPIEISRVINRCTVVSQKLMQKAGAITEWDPTQHRWGREKLLEEGDPDCSHKTKDHPDHTRVDKVTRRNGETMLLKYFECIKCGKQNVKWKVVQPFTKGHGYRGF